MPDLRELLVEEADRLRPDAIPPFETVVARSARRRRWGAGLALVAVAAVSVVAAATVRGSHSDDPAAEEPTAWYEVNGISFRYPTAWRPQQFPQWARGGLSTVITYLSTEQLTDPCRTTAPSEITCGPPQMTLPPGGVLITWTRWNTFASHPLSDLPGSPITVYGHPAGITSTATAERCAGFGAAREIHAVIVLDPVEPYHQWLDMTACLAGPDTARSEEQVNAMLASLRINAGR